MSKAYGSVNIDLLKLSFKYFQFPNQLINILTNLLLFQSNQIITNLGLSPHYSVHDRIDQGETITLLLWRIYYDPLINKIKTNFTAYTISSTYTFSIHSIQNQTIQTSPSILAYMDDTLLIASSSNQLQQILDTAATFYSIAHIQVNPSKSILLSNTKSQSSFHFFNSQIPTQPLHTPFKFLGC